MILNSPVSCFDVSYNGDLLVFGTGNDWCLGVNKLAEQKNEVKIGCKILGS